MTEEETHNSMLKAASLVTNALNVLIGGLSPGFEPDPEQTELLLAEGFLVLLDEIDGPVEGGEERAVLAEALRAYIGQVS